MMASFLILLVVEIPPWGEMLASEELN